MTTLAHRLQVLPPVLRFGLVGGAGFLVDGGLLQLLVWAGWGPITARLVSFPAAVLATWWLNREITFRGQDHGSLLGSLARYVAVSLVGTSINFGIYTSCVLASSAMATQPLVPFAIASIVAMAFNYLGSKHFAFRA
ncbi:GtrA family protein [Ramlibacter humi]|nr:GtrA family protein [Ramlibacter humi]